MDRAFIVYFLLTVASPSIGSSLHGEGTSLKATNPKNDTIESSQLCRLSGYVSAFPGLRVTNHNGKKTFYLLEGLERWPLTISNKRITVSGELIVDTTGIDYRKGTGLIKNPLISPKNLLLTSPALFNADKRFSRQRITTDLQLNSVVKEPRSGDSIIIESYLKNSSKKGYLILRPLAQHSYDIRLKECEEWNPLKVKNERQNSNDLTSPVLKDTIFIDTVFLAPGKQIKWQENIMRYSYHNLIEPDTCQIRVHYVYSGNLSDSKKTTGIQAYLDSAVGIPNFDIVSKPIDIYFTKSNINALNDNMIIDKRINSGEGTIFIASIPPGADVYLGRTLIGRTNTSSLKVPAGIHCLRFVKNGREIVQQFDIKPGKNQSNSVRFQ
jgi:hypothetical protein